MYSYFQFVKPTITNKRKLNIIVTSATVAGTFVKNSAIPGRQFIFTSVPTFRLRNHLRSELAIPNKTYAVIVEIQNTKPINTVIFLSCCPIRTAAGINKIDADIRNWKNVENQNKCFIFRALLILSPLRCGQTLPLRSFQAFYHRYKQGTYASGCREVLWRSRQ